MPHNVTLHIIPASQPANQWVFQVTNDSDTSNSSNTSGSTDSSEVWRSRTGCGSAPPWSFSLKFHSIQAWWAHTNPHNTSEADPIWEFTHIWQASSYGQRQPSISWLNEWTQNHQIRCLSYHPAVHSEANELYIALEHRLTFRTWSKVKWPLQVGKKRILKDTRKKGGPWQTSFQVMPPRFHMTLLKSTYQPLMSSLSVHLRHLQLFKRPTIPVLQRWPCVVWIDRWLVKGWCRFCTMRRCPGLGSRVIDVIDVLCVASCCAPIKASGSAEVWLCLFTVGHAESLQYWIGVLRQKVSSNSFCAATATRRVISFAVDLFWGLSTLKITPLAWNSSRPYSNNQSFCGLATTCHRLHLGNGDCLHHHLQRHLSNS